MLKEIPDIMGCFMGKEGSKLCAAELEREGFLARPWEVGHRICEDVYDWIYG